MIKWDAAFKNQICLDHLITTRGMGTFNLHVPFERSSNPCTDQEIASDNPLLVAEFNQIESFKLDRKSLKNKFANAKKVYSKLSNILNKMNF